MGWLTKAEKLWWAELMLFLKIKVAFTCSLACLMIGPHRGPKIIRWRNHHCLHHSNPCWYPWSVHVVCCLSCRTFMTILKGFRESSKQFQSCLWLCWHGWFHQNFCKKLATYGLLARFNNSECHRPPSSEMPNTKKKHLQTRLQCKVLRSKSVVNDLPASTCLSGYGAWAVKIECVPLQGLAIILLSMAVSKQNSTSWIKSSITSFIGWTTPCWQNRQICHWPSQSCRWVCSYVANPGWIILLIPGASSHHELCLEVSPALHHELIGTAGLFSQSCQRLSLLYMGVECEVNISCQGYSA